MRDLIRSQPVYEIQYYGKTFRMNAAQVLHDKYMIWCGEQLWSAFVLASVVALVICLITFFVVSWILGRQGKQQSENEITGGRQLTDNPKEVARMLKKDGKDSDTFLRNSPAANLVEEKIEKTAISIRAVLTNYVKAIRYLQGIEHNGEPFTIRDWMAVISIVPATT